MARTTSTTWRAGWRRWSWRWTATRTAAPSIVNTARRTAALYLMQFHHVMEDEAQ